MSDQIERLFADLGQLAVHFSRKLEDVKRLRDEQIGNHASIHMLMDAMMKEFRTITADQTTEIKEHITATFSQLNIPEKGFDWSLLNLAENDQVQEPTPEASVEDTTGDTQDMTEHAQETVVSLPSIKDLVANDRVTEFMKEAHRRAEGIQPEQLVSSEPASTRSNDDASTAAAGPVPEPAPAPRAWEEAILANSEPIILTPDPEEEEEHEPPVSAPIPTEQFHYPVTTKDFAPAEPEPEKELFTANAWSINLASEEDSIRIVTSKGTLGLNFYDPEEFQRFHVAEDRSRLTYENDDRIITLPIANFRGWHSCPLYLNIINIQNNGDWKLPPHFEILKDYYGKVTDVFTDIGAFEYRDDRLPPEPSKFYYVSTPDSKPPVLRIKPIPKELYSGATPAPAPAPAQVYQEHQPVQRIGWDPNKPNSKENALPSSMATGTQVFREPLPEVNTKAVGEGQWETRPVMQPGGVDIVMKPVWIPKNPHLMAMSQPGASKPLTLTPRRPEDLNGQRIGNGSFTVN